MNRFADPNPEFQVISCTGRLTRETELRELPNGGSVCKLRLAVDDIARGRETGYINVSTFGKPGEAAAEVLSTDWLVAVDGRLEYHEWEQDGKTRHDYEMIGSVEFLARRVPAPPTSNPSGPRPDCTERDA
jgi:single-strand DNA-binding protein